MQHLDGGPPHRDLDLPLDVKATAFQRRVWAELRAIPYGTTRSYGEIAEALGLPRAARAVARACASNRVALVIPCHRVVRGDGDISGYRWGKERKRVLLDLERRRSGRVERRLDPSPSPAGEGARGRVRPVPPSQAGLTTGRFSEVARAPRLASAHSLRRGFRSRTRLLLRGGGHLRGWSGRT